MSYLNTKTALLTQLLGNLPTGVTDQDVSYENNKFEPKGKDIWLAAYFIPATSEATGKDTNDTDIEEGMYQISVFVKLNSDNYDIAQLTAIDELKSAFRPSSQLVYNDQTVNIKNSSLTSGTEAGAFFQRDLTINYLTISER